MSIPIKEWGRSLSDLAFGVILPFEFGSPLPIQSYASLLRRFFLLSPQSSVLITYSTSLLPRG